MDAVQHAQVQMASHTTMTLIGQEFERLKEIDENKSNNAIMDYLDKTNNEIRTRGICNPRGPYQKSLIHFAAMGDCTALLQNLLDIGAPVGDRDENRRTPLSWAAEYCSLRAIKILLKNGAKVNSRDDVYASPLYWLEEVGDPGHQNYEASISYLKKNGATTKASKRAWILKKLRLI